MSKNIDSRSRSEDSRTHENLDRVLRYKRPGQLPVPTSHPERHHRWVAMDIGGVTNTKNMTKRFEDGYALADHTDYPELAFLAFGQENPKGPIRYAEHALAYTSQEKADLRKAYYEFQTTKALEDQQERVEVEARTRGVRVMGTESNFGSDRPRRRFDA